MASFNKRKISANLEAIGEQLKRARQEKKIEIKKAAALLNIRLDYLKAIENGDFNKLPAGIYRKNYLREYALFLNLEAEQFLKIYNNEIDKSDSRDAKRLFSKKIPKALHFFILPKIIKNSLIALIILGLAAYLGFCAQKIISPPKLIIYYPEHDMTINHGLIKIQGQTEKEAKLLINGETILLDAKGNFVKNIDLKNGLNIISISAQKKYSRKNTLTRKIIVNH